MIQLPLDAPCGAACGRSGLPLMAVCPAGHRRSVPWPSLKTHNDDETPLDSRPFKCFVCGCHEVTLFAIETQAELDEVRATLLRREGVNRGIGIRTNEPEDPEVRFL